MLWEVATLRQDEHIRKLCAKVIAANDAELEPAIAELNNALREHSQKLRELAAEKLSPKSSAAHREP
jgi:hypothetical protein